MMSHSCLRPVPTPADQHCCKLWPAQRACPSLVICRIAKIAPELVQLERSCLADLSTEELEQQLKKHGVSLQDKTTRLAAPSSKQKHRHTGGQQAAGAEQQQQHHPSNPAHSRPKSSLQRTGQQSPPAPPQQRQDPVCPPQAAATAADQSHQQQQQQQQHQHQQQQQQQQQQPVSAAPHGQRHIKARTRRVAAAAARRALLLEQLATARVQARSRIVRLPLRLSVAGRAKSRRYLTLPVDVEGTGFVDFLIDSSSYLSRITPAMRDKLGFSPTDGVAIVAGASGSSGSSGGGSSDSGGGGSSSGRMRVKLRQRVTMPKMWLGTAQLPPQQAYVTSLQLPPRQQQFSRPLGAGGSSGSSGSSMPRILAAAGTVGGVLGVQVLREFEVDVDIGGNAVALHPPGHVELGLCDTRGLVEIPLRLTKTGALVIPVSLAGSPPFTGLLDLSAASSMLNWEAASLLGMHCELDDSDDDSDSSSGSSSSGSSSSGSSKAQQQQRQQRAAIKHVGKFGSLDVVPAEEMLPKPILPKAQPPGSTPHQPNSSSRSSSMFRSQPLLPPLPSQRPGEPGKARRSSSSSSSSSSSRRSSRGSSSGSAGRYSYSYTPLSGSSIVQQHQVAASDVRLVLGHARLAAAAAAASGPALAPAPVPGSGGSIAASLALPPPNRFGVAGLKAVEQLGLSGQPVMIVGWDVWARQRAVLCLKAGKLFLSAAGS